MKTGLHTICGASALIFSVTVLAGCYTQLGTVHSERERTEDEPVVYDDRVDDADSGYYSEAYYEDEYYPSPNYHVTFSYYYPSAWVGFGYGYWDPWYTPYYDPWYGYYPYYPGSWYCHYPSPYVYWPPVYGCWPGAYYGYYYPPYYGGYYGHHGSGGYYPGFSGREITTRDFGSTRGITGRTVGGTRGTGRSGGLRTNDPDAASMPVATVSDRTPAGRNSDAVAPGAGRSQEKATRKRSTRRYVVPGGARVPDSPRSDASRPGRTSVRSRAPQGSAPGGTSMKPQSAPPRSGTSVQPRSSTRSSSPPARSAPRPSSGSSGSRSRPR